MSFVITLPQLLTAAALQLEGIGSSISAANLTAALPTTGIVPAAADTVSAVTAQGFSTYGQLYQAISAEAAVIHERFVQTLGLSANSYQTAEAANAMSAGSGAAMSTSGVGARPASTVQPGATQTRVGQPGEERPATTAPVTKQPATAPPGVERPATTQPATSPPGTKHGAAGPATGPLVATRTAPSVPANQLPVELA